MIQDGQLSGPSPYFRHRPIITDFHRLPQFRTQILEADVLPYEWTNESRYIEKSLIIYNSYFARELPNKFENCANFRLHLFQ